MRRLLLAVALLAVTLAGCETTKVDSSAIVTVAGRVLQPDGTPAAGVPVGLERELSVGDVLVGLFVIPLTLATACLADPPPELCRSRSVRKTTAGPDGTYSFRLAGRDTQTAFANARSLSLATELPAGAGEVGGPAVTATFKVQTEGLTVPDLQAWQPRVIAGSGRIGWEELKGAGAYQVGAEDNGRQAVWSFESRTREVTFDPRILEDTAGTVAVGVRSGATAQGTSVDVVRRSGRFAYRSTAGAPPSRGKACTRGPAGAPLARCPLTDGDLASSLPELATTSTAAAASPAPPVTEAPSADWATIDLGQPRSTSLVVVRGCECEVAGSVDGQTWTALGRAAGYTAVVPSRTAQARYVRVTGELSGLREVSVWDGAPPSAGPALASPPSAATPANPGDEALRPPAASMPSEPSRRPQALAALAALFLVAVASAVVASRRRR